MTVSNFRTFLECCVMIFIDFYYLAYIAVCQSFIKDDDDDNDASNTYYVKTAHCKKPSNKFTRICVH